MAASGPSARRLLGSAGEAAAERWYRDHGYQILARNWRRREGEIDLVAAKGRVVVFCEVKARTTDAFGVPAEAVTRTKQQRLRRLAARWLAETPAGRPASVRFDVAAVLGGAVEIIEGAF